MTTGHTPGPWFADDVFVGSKPGRHDIVSGIGGDYSSREAEANARLVASAPDLKAENERLREAIKTAIAELAFKGFDDNLFDDGFKRLQRAISSDQTPSEPDGINGTENAGEPTGRTVIPERSETSSANPPGLTESPTDARNVRGHTGQPELEKAESRCDKGCLFSMPPGQPMPRNCILCGHPETE